MIRFVRGPGGKLIFSTIGSNTCVIHYTYFQYVVQSNLKWPLSIATIIHLIACKRYHYFQRLLGTFPEHTQLLVERFGG